MTNYQSMSATFEREKNIRASLYTLGICVLLFLLFFFLQWTLPQIPPPLANEGIEVNLGNSETGSGEIAPQIPGSTTDTKETAANPPNATKAVAQPQNIATDDHADADAPAFNKAAKPLKKSLPIRNEIEPSKRTSNTSLTNTPPAPIKPKAVYQSGNTHSNGGNNADSYNGIKNQGIAGGKGDQGNPNGNPNSDSYTGNSASGNGSDITIRSGLEGRKFSHFPSFQDDFNENAKVAIDITVDKSGSVLLASVNPKGTTTTNAAVRSIALRKAKQLKLNAGKDDEQTGTIVFNFKLHN